MAYSYFLSYARLDRDNDPFGCIPRFFEDLDREIRRRLVIRQGLAGFFDREGIEPGDLWPEALGGALQSCRSLICLYSAAYFDSEYCGKEWSAFDLRLAKYRADGSPQGRSAPLILPVLFDPPQDLVPLPEGVADIQYDDADYPDVYRENGLRYLMVRQSPALATAYEDFKDALVRRLLQLLEEHNLDPLDTLPEIKKVPSYFHHACAAAAVEGGQSPALSRGSGPRYADFVYVAASRDEISSIKTNVEGYGEEGGLDWKPYWPDPAKEAGLLAQGVATNEGFRYQVLPLSENLEKQVAEAREKNRIVILLADAWTLCLERYRDIIRRYDGIDSWNSAVTVAWNTRDEETRKQQTRLAAGVRVAFIAKSRRDKGKYFVDSSTAQELESSLGILLQRLKVEVSEISEDLRTIPSDIGRPDILTAAGGTAV
jgi:FxsC-like protein